MATIQRETIKKDGSVSFQIAVSNGSANRKTVTYNAKSKALTKARKEAERFGMEYEQQFRNGDIVENEKITFSKFADDIWAKNWLPSKTPTVQENYKAVLRVRVYPFIGKMKLTAIRATHIDKILKAEAAEENKAANTVRMTFTVINSVFRYALKKQYVRENPCLRCDDLPHVSIKTGNDLSFWNKEQAKAFLYKALTRKYAFSYKGHKRIIHATGKEYAVTDYKEAHTIPFQWKVYFTIAIFCGLRRGEACALAWKDIDLKNGFISINKAIAATQAGQIVKRPKTDAGIRDIAIPAFCTSMLSRLKQEQQAKALEMGTAWKGHRNSKEDSFEENNLFIQFDGSPIHLSTPGHKFREIIDLYNSTCEKEEDKLPVIRLHDLRHTSATLLLSDGTDIETVSRRLGHSKASVTLDIYGHALPENDRKAAEALESMLG